MMDDAAYHVERSRATEPLFFRAPFPPQKDGAKPREFQHAGVEFALAREHCLIGDEPGVGKTLQGILISNAIGAKRTLVVCPASLRLNWRAEIWKWSNLPNIMDLTYVVQKASDGVSTEANYVIISYDLLRNVHLLGAILDIPWDHIILDEAHAIKDVKRNKRTKAIFELRENTDARFTLLSGTILPNQPIEVYNTCRLLDWSAINFMSVEDFREEYYDLGGGMIRGPVWDDKLQANVSKVHWSESVRNQPTNLADLQRRLRSKIMIRRLKEDVHKQLPSKQFHLVPLPLTPEIKAALKHPGWEAATKLYDLDPGAFATKVDLFGEEVSTARRLLGEAKAGLVMRYIDDLLESGVQKLVVSAWHSSVLAVAKAHLARYGLAYMDGKTGMGARQKAVEQFQTDPKIRVILGQTAVIGEGHTLTAAQDVVLCEPDYVPGRITQMIDRIHRLGQEGSHVIAHLPIAPGTLDERIVATAVGKDRAIHLALDAR
jgi:SWI/SNF-related matrix-associated actin-dependent regulator 1 of chromatin subfamily A